MSNDWKFVTLGQLCQPKQWPTLSKKDLDDHGFPVFGANGVIGFSQYKTHESDTILIACRGTCGRINIARGEFYANGNAMALDHLDTNQIELNFLARYLSFRGLSDVTTGSSQPQITRENLLKIHIPLPPITEQRRISRILDCADDLREQALSVLSLLGELEEATISKIFENISISNTKLRTISSLIDKADRLNYGVVQPGLDYEDGIPLIRAGDIKDGAVSTKLLKKISPAIESTYSRSRIVGTEVLISCVGSIGNVAIVESTHIGFNIARAVARIPIVGHKERVFVAAVLRSQHAKLYFESEARTVSQPTLNIKQLSEFEIPWPSEQVIHKIANQILEIGQVRKQTLAKIFSLDELFAALENRAFKGEL